MSIKISVIIPVFNREKYIARCLRSLLNQSMDRKDYELIVINDGSKDKTKEVLDMFKDENEVPKKSPIGSKDKEQIKIKISELVDQKNNIQAEIEKLLRK